MINIFNYYIENSFAAYLEEKVPYEFFAIMKNINQGYPMVAAKDPKGKVLGFGMLRPHSPIPTFSRTAEFSCFLAPDQRGRGIGSAILEDLTGKAKMMGITILLSSISSLNSESQGFHLSNGFVEVGRFKGIGRKRGLDFDVIWMQKTL